MIMEVKHRMMRGLVVFGTVFLGGFSLLPIDAFADPGLDFSVVISDVPILEINLSDANGSAIGATTTMDVVPDHGTAAFNEKNMVVSVGTNNEWGYNLNMNVSNTVLTSQENSNNTIANLASKAGGYTCSVDTAETCDFTVNSWGYKIASATNISAATNYLPVVSSVNLNHYNNRTNGDLTYVSFGSKVNAMLAPGTYSTTINFVATANPEPIPTMQNISASELASLVPKNGDATKLLDTRDNSRYTVGRLADGKVWLLDNLALDLTDSAVQANLSSATTNASNSTLNYLKGISISTIDDGYARSAVSASTSNYGSEDKPTIKITDKNTSRPLAANQNETGKVGIYYSYCAASAGSYCWDTYTSYDKIDEDICPAGWRMPTGNSSGEYQALYAAYSDNDTAFRSALRVLSGFNIWSSTVMGSFYEAYTLSSGYGASEKVDGDTRSLSTSVRCVFGGDGLSMQGATNSTLSELAPNGGDIVELYDERDFEKYEVINIGGVYWMNQNLRIIRGVPASSSNFVGEEFDVRSGGWLTKSGDNISEPRAGAYGIVTGVDTPTALYNYCAASAGTVCSDSSQQDAVSDICPAGWRLPTINEAEAAINVHWTKDNAGYVYDYSYRTDHTMWWTSTHSDNNSARRMAISLSNNDGVSLEDIPVEIGAAIRCVKAKDPIYMQDVTKDKLKELMPNKGDSAVLYDKRDNKTYTVARLSDYRVWMLSNLALDPATTILTLSSSNTNMPENDKTGFAETFSKMESTTSGFDSFTEPMINAAYKDSYQDLTISQSEKGKTGVYYNFCAASAGTYCTEKSGGGDAEYDICPSNWRLPTGGSGGEYEELRSAYDSDENFVAALKLPRSGYFVDEKVYSAGSKGDGYLWSSTWLDQKWMNDIEVYDPDSIEVENGWEGERNVGMPIRCISKF